MYNIMYDCPRFFSENAVAGFVEHNERGQLFSYYTLALALFV